MLDCKRLTSVTDLLPPNSKFLIAARLPAKPRQSDSGRNRKIQRIHAATDWNSDAIVGCRLHRRRQARALAADDKRQACWPRPRDELVERLRWFARRQRDECEAGRTEFSRQPRPFRI